MEDEEFQQFLLGVKEKDVQMDEMLTGISHSLSGLKQNAQGINRELGKQHNLLADIEDQTEHSNKELEGANKRMTKILKDTRGVNFCMYIICLLLLLGIAGAIVLVVRM
eukprot:TRINITY_DN57649_c0_g1_i1.p1 TRINITY_DN57649_c0_g1~~TRINITY_DN57649_c0_g1_i1.p1  ORF type:complete len:109 (+),score=24.52 TRINITY_DN57649_c0_g1_i1:153-479(+)